jgi:hypothetical protein
VKVVEPCSTWDIVCFYIFFGVEHLVTLFLKTLQMFPGYFYGFYESLVSVLHFYVNDQFYSLFYLLMKVS